MCSIYKNINKFLKSLGELSLVAGVICGIFGIIYLIFNGIDEKEITYVGYGIEYLLYVSLAITYGLISLNIYKAYNNHNTIADEFIQNNRKYYNKNIKD